MSGGQSDFNAVNDLGTELEETAYQLRDAIQKTVEGHRGLTVDVLSVVNPILSRTGYRMYKDK